MTTTAAATVAPLGLAHRKGSKVQGWKYFATEADDRGLISDLQKAICKLCYCAFRTKRGVTSKLEAP